MEPYNPLDRFNLARSVETTLMQRDPLALPLTASFKGAGLYALYYQGGFAPYAPISSAECIVPIYVGKADPPGARKGIVSAAGAGTALYNRIGQHATSITSVENLEIGDFRVRYLVVEDLFIGLGEQLLIQQFKPLWNQHVSGFGIHTPGADRFGGKRSDWDELHPGRPWHGKMVQTTTAADIKKKIKIAFESEAAATVEEATAALESAPVMAPLPLPAEEHP
jgi:hypothetical protein